MERWKEFDDKGMVVQALHDLQLSKDLLVAALLLHDETLAHSFYRVEWACVFFTGEVNLLSEAAFANNLDLIKVLHGHHVINVLFSSFCDCSSVSSGSFLVALLHLLGEDCD